MIQARALKNAARKGQEPEQTFSSDMISPSMHFGSEFEH